MTRHEPSNWTNNFSIWTHPESPQFLAFAPGTESMTSVKGKGMRKTPLEVSIDRELGSPSSPKTRYASSEERDEPAEHLTNMVDEGAFSGKSLVDFPPQKKQEHWAF